MRNNRDTNRDGDDDAIADAAAQWLARRDRGLTPAESAELKHWTAANPRHAVELARLESAWRGFDRARAAPELVAMAGDIPRASSLYARRITAWSGVLAAAAAVIALIAGVTWRQTASTPGGATPAIASGPSYHVLPSTARRITFEDGSTAELRGDSQVQAEFTATERRITLVRGEAHFTVLTDAARPFIVSANNTAVRAVGTAFNVRFDPKYVEILVTEGKVQVTDMMPNETVALAPPVLVVAGERAVVERASEGGVVAAPAKVDVTPAAPTEIEQTLAWQTTRLVFDRTPLDEAVEAFNRHAASVSGIELVIGDPVLRTRRLGGTFRAANVEAFIRLLEQTEEIRVEQRGGQRVLLPVR